MSRSEDVLVGDDGSSTRRGFAITEADEHDPDLPGILVYFSLSSSDDPRRSVGLSTVAILNWLGLFWTVGKPRKY